MKRKVLFLCTGNSARSIIAEFLLKKKGSARFESYSAGSRPKGVPHPLALRTLRETFHVDPGDARSKSWDEFRDVKFDFVITLCDSAREECPFWPGQPIVAHWGSPDPAAATGSEEERMRAFSNVAWQICRRLELFLSLPMDKLDKLGLEMADAVKRIGEQELIP